MKIDWKVQYPKLFTAMCVSIGISAIALALMFFTDYDSYWLCLLGVGGMGVCLWIWERKDFADSFKKNASIQRKLYCVYSKEAIDLMKGSRGKLAAQAGHAYLHAFWDAQKRFPLSARGYQDSDHAYKIALVVDDEAALRRLEESYRSVCGVSLVTDAGFTVFKGPTTTCLGIGPIDVSKIKDDLRNLKTLQ